MIRCTASNGFAPSTSGRILYRSHVAFGGRDALGKHSEINWCRLNRNSKGLQGRGQALLIIRAAGLAVNVVRYRSGRTESKAAVLIHAHCHIASRIRRPHSSRGSSKPEIRIGHRYDVIRCADGFPKIQNSFAVGSGRPLIKHIGDQNQRQRDFRLQKSSNQSILGLSATTVHWNDTD